MTISRRDLLMTGAGLAGAAALPGLTVPAFAQGAAMPEFKPEPGASLRMLRWSPFVMRARKMRGSPTPRSSPRPPASRCASTRKAGKTSARRPRSPPMWAPAGIVWVWFDDAQQYPDKLLDVTPLANGLAAKYGGWYEAPALYTKKDGKFIRPAARHHRQCRGVSRQLDEGSRVQRIPEGHQGVPGDGQGPEGQDHPMGFTLGHGVGDGNNFCHWVLWSHGGKMVDDNAKVVINSPETVAALRYVAELYRPSSPARKAGWT